MKHHGPRGAVTASHAPPCVCCDVPVSARILPWQWGGLDAPLIHPVSPLLPPPGSPLQFYVDYVNSGHVTAYGPGLIHGTVNKPATFTVNTKDAGEGEPLGGSARRLGPPQQARGPPLNPTCPPPTPQEVCRWLWRVPPRRRSAAPTTRTGRAASPTCRCCPGTTASW